MFTKGSPLGIAVVAISLALTGIIMLFIPINKLVGVILLFLGVIFFTLSRWLKRYLK